MGRPHCPSCKYFNVDCHVDYDEYNLPCDYYSKASREELKLRKLQEQAVEACNEDQNQ